MQGGYTKKNRFLHNWFIVYSFQIPKRMAPKIRGHCNYKAQGIRRNKLYAGSSG